MIQSRREYAIIIDYSALAGEIFIKYFFSKQFINAKKNVKTQNNALAEYT